MSGTPDTCNLSHGWKIISCKLLKVFLLNCGQINGLTIKQKLNEWIHPRCCAVHMHNTVTACVCLTDWSVEVRFNMKVKLKAFTGSEMLLLSASVEKSHLLCLLPVTCSWNNDERKSIGWDEVILLYLLWKKTLTTGFNSKLRGLSFF